MTDIHWVVLYGGVSSEREISLISGKAVVDALAAHRQVRAVDLRERSLPKNLDPAKHLIFPVFHGEFGEDGEVQSLLEEQGFIFAGCNAQSSALCMHKQRTKVAVAHYGIPVPQGMDFNWQNPRRRTRS
ncbi:MAG: hypothetical protein LR015_15650 [Verrucomicrobia bacterium]|nr:hypothetical protein [Verrucomicrobiota bacterium]